MEMPYLLKQAGCHVDVLCPSSNWAIKNSFYDRWIDAGDSLESLISRLEKVVNRENYDYVMIGDDPILWKIYLEKNTTLRYLLPIGNEMALPILNKIGFAKYCHNLEIPSPDFQVLRNQSEAYQTLKTMGLPLVVKENYSNGGNGVTVYEDVQSYDRFMARYDFVQPLLAQRFIKGRHIAVEALFKGGKLLQYICSVVSGDDLGPSSKRQYIDNDDQIGAIINKLGMSALLHGFANITLIQDKNNQTYYLIEADPRPNKWVPYGRWFGRDFAIAFKSFLAANDDNLPVCIATSEEVQCKEVEHFDSHLAKLLRSGQQVEALFHLLDFDKNFRYTVYDPVLLKAKMDNLYRQLLPQRAALEANTGRYRAEHQSLPTASATD